MKNLFAFACFGAFCSFGLLTASAAEGEVTADRLNVRLKPDLKAPVVVKLDRGFQVDVRGENGEFVEIAAPVTVPVYISAVYLNGNEDKTTAPTRMYVAGASQAASYGVLPKGSSVKVLAIDQHYWAKIEPPAGLKLYVAKRYVRYTPKANSETEQEVKPEAKPEEKPEVKSEATPAASSEVIPEAKPAEKTETKPEENPAVKPEATPAASFEVIPKAKPAEKPETKPEENPAAKSEATPAANSEVTPEATSEAKPEAKPATVKMSAATEAALRELRVTPQEGTPVTEKGTLLRIENTTVPLLQYALMKGNTHIYYICTDQVKLADFGDRELTFQGRSFKVPGWRVPVLYVESAVPVQ